jgi:hypothetical protein
VALVAGSFRLVVDVEARAFSFGFVQLVVFVGMPALALQMTLAYAGGTHPDSDEAVNVRHVPS